MPRSAILSFVAGDARRGSARSPLPLKNQFDYNDDRNARRAGLMIWPIVECGHRL
jgi:hypothetical protein